MSHIVGTVQPVPSAFVIGPASGVAPDSPGLWTKTFEPTPAPAPGGLKLVLLHFQNVSLPGSNRLEVELGYGGGDSVDVFTSADGPDLWTRPVNVAAFADGKVPIRYIVPSGPAAGGATLDRYGRGERHGGDEQGSTTLSNCDPFMVDGSYTEPVYDPHWYCLPQPDWENVACVPSASDVRRTVARSVGMVLHVDKSEHLTPQIDVLSTCSVTLIGPDLVITAGHCMAEPEEHARSASVIFNYEIECGGGVPAGYAGRFFRVKEVVAQAWTPGAGNPDYCLLRLAVPPGLPPIQMRHDLPALGEQVFGIHHPNGAVKKLSLPHPGFATVTGSSSGGVQVPSQFHVSGGSSGSGLFDMAGRIVGVLSVGNPCDVGTNFPLGYYPTATILQTIATPPATPVATRDVMIVLDRSGSMSLPGASGRPKIDEARDAASLFVQLVRAGTGNRVGLVSFSTGPNLEFGLQPVTGPNKTTLIGPPPYSAGKIGGLLPDGLTTIGGGLKAAGNALPSGGTNPRTILLLTDGLQNTPPMIGDQTVQDALGGIAVDAIGYGTESSLDGPLLEALAQAHDGSYARADTMLQLEKFFAQAFGNIFEAGLLSDPEFVLAAEDHVADPFPFRVCGEETITIVVGWDNLDTTLHIELETPAGAKIGVGAAGTESATGRSWTFLRVPLPHLGERDGEWNLIVFRPRSGSVEFPDSVPETRYFVAVTAAGGPKLRRVAERPVYHTGDLINPLVALSYDEGGSPEEARVSLTVTRPKTAAGNLLSQHGLGPAKPVAGDIIPARQATLQAIEAQTGKPAIAYAEESFELDGGPDNTNGAFESPGLFGKALDQLLTVEGSYTFHAVATYGEDCVSTRELKWTVHVEPSVDPARTTTTVSVTDRSPDGTSTGTVTVTPRDPYGNQIGPGRGGGLEISGGAGTTVTGSVTDNGDGSYTIPVSWDPGAGGPSVVIGQPGRPPVVVGGGKPCEAPERRHCRWCILVCLLLALLVLVLLVLMWRS